MNSSWGVRLSTGELESGGAPGVASGGSPGRLSRPPPQGSGGFPPLPAPPLTTGGSRPVAVSPRRSSPPSVSRSSRSVVSASLPAISRLESGGRAYGGRFSAPPPGTTPPHPPAPSPSLVRQAARPP